MYAVKPDKGSGWGKRTLRRFLGKTEAERNNSLIEIAEEFGFDTGEADNMSGKLTLKGADGKTTTFSLDQDPRAPYLYIPINKEDGTKLNDKEFVEKCRELVAKYMERCWHAEMSLGGKAFYKGNPFRLFIDSIYE